MINIAGFNIHELVGQGGMATVYKATDSQSRCVALKVLSPSLAADPNFLSRFQKEIRLLTKLDHPNIVKVFQAGEHEHKHYISMEFADNGELEDKIKHGLQPEQALQYLIQIAQGLNYAHQKGYIHRDMKPANILFRKDGSLMVSDFGIAKPLSGTETITVSLTKTGVSIGTPHYMSPEQARGQTLDYRADLYSLGCIFYEMLTQQKCYDADDGFAVCLMHINDSIPQLPSHLQFFQPTLNKLLAKNPDDRFTTTAQLIEHLQQLSSKLQTQDFSATVVLPICDAIPKKPKRFLKPTLLTLTIGGLFAATGYFSYPHWSVYLNNLTATTATTQTTVPITTSEATSQEDTGRIQDAQNTPQPQSVTQITTDAQPEQPAATTPAPEATQPVVEPVTTTPVVDQPPADTHTTPNITTTPATVEPTWQTLLTAAQQDLQANRLTKPEGDNAFQKFTEVLQQDPNNAEAKQGLQTIAARYVSLAQRKLKQQQFAQAMQYLEKAQQVNPQHATLNTLRQQIAQAQQAAQQNRLQAQQDKPQDDPKPAATINPALLKQSEELAQTYTLLIEQAIANQKWSIAESYLGKLQQLAATSQSSKIKRNLKNLRSRLEQQVRLRAQQMANSQQTNTAQPTATSTEQNTAPTPSRDVNRISSPF